MQRCRYAWPVLVCVLVAAAPRPAAAQGTEIFGGYSYLWDPANSVLAVTARDNTYVRGWIAGAAVPLWKRIRIAAEASGHYKAKTTFDDDVSLSFHAGAAGPRLQAPIGPFTQFAQLLAGVAHARGSAFGGTASATAPLVQPGGGIDYPWHPRFAARLQVDYRWIHGRDGRSNVSQFRAVAALVVR